MTDKVTMTQGEIEQLKKDAERYRWLRKQPNDCTAPRIDICLWSCGDDDSVNNGEGIRLEDADREIDEAMRKESKNDQPW